MCCAKKQDDLSAADIGNNLALLFGCNPDETVLVVGQQLYHWADIFPNAVHWNHVSVNNTGHDIFSLVLCHAGCATSRSRLVRDLKVLRSLIRPGGTLLFWGRNLFSFTNIKQLKNNNWKSLSPYPKLSLAGYTKVLQESGFLESQSYLVLPDLESPEEIVSIGSPLVELPGNCHLLLRLAHRYKLFKYIADSYLFIDSCNPIETRPLIRRIESNLREAGHRKDIQCILERFDLRMRGAMVLFLSEYISGKKYIVRVVSNLTTREIVCRNEQFVLWLLRHKRLAETVKRQLPCPIASFDFAGSTVFIETQVSGTLAWKVNALSLREVIFQEACDFIFQLQQATKCNTTIDSKALQKLFSPVGERLRSCNGVDKSFLCELMDVVEKMQGIMIGHVYALTASHGDYGYGNILVEPRSGKLTGVIDWDTGRRFDLAGLDLYNLLVQRGRIEKGYDVFQSFSEAVREILSQNGLDAAGRYARDFGISGNVLQVLLYVGFLRYVSRSAQYPQVYGTEQNEYIKALQFLKTEVPL